MNTQQTSTNVKIASANSFIIETAANKLVFCLMNTKPFENMHVRMMAEKRLYQLVRDGVKVLIQERGGPAKRFTRQQEVAEDKTITSNKYIVRIESKVTNEDVAWVLIKEGLVLCVPYNHQCPTVYATASLQAKANKNGYFSGKYDNMVDLTMNHAMIPTFCVSVKNKWLKCTILDSLRSTPLHVKVEAVHEGTTYLMNIMMAGVSGSTLMNDEVAKEIIAKFEGKVSITGYRQLEGKDRYKVYGLFVTNSGVFINAQMIIQSKALYVQQCAFNNNKHQHMALRTYGTPISYNKDYNYHGFSDMEHMLMMAATIKLNDMQRKPEVPVMPETPRKRFVFIDNSNVFVSGLEVSGKRAGMINLMNNTAFCCNSAWRVNYANFMNTFFGTKRENLTTKLFCSTMQSTNLLKGIEDCGIEVAQYKRCYGKEKGVDCGIVASICEVIATQKPEDCEIILVSGDGDFAEVINNAIAKGFTCRICAYETTGSNSLKFIMNELASFYPLEPYLDTIEFVGDENVTNEKDLQLMLQEAGVEESFIGICTESKVSAMPKGTVTSCNVFPSSIEPTERIAYATKVQQLENSETVVPPLKIATPTSPVDTMELKKDELVAKVPSPVKSQVNGFIHVHFIAEKGRKRTMYPTSYSVQMMLAELNKSNNFPNYGLFLPNTDSALGESITLEKLPQTESGTVELEFKMREIEAW